jgi:dTDP-4-dehydrorhamnose 3,5-epimerase
MPAPDLEGVRAFPLDLHADPRGAFAEIYRRAWSPAFDEMVQANLSWSKARVLRGLHVHREQADLWVVVSGRMLVGLFDLRLGSATRGRKQEIALDAERDRVALYLPPGVAHGFCAETDVTLLYLVDRPYSGADELGLAWDDPEVGIDWPVAEPILSDRDRANPSLAELLDGPPFTVR